MHATSPGIRPTCRPARELAQRAGGGLVHQPAGFFGVPFRVWYPSETTGRPTMGRRCCPRKAGSPWIPSTDVPEGYRTISAAYRALCRRPGTSWTRGQPPRSPRRSPAAGRKNPICSRACSRWTVRPQAHDIIRTWLFRQSSGRCWSTGRLRGRTRISDGCDPDRKKIVEVQGQRRDPPGACWTSRVGRRALLGRQRAPGTDTTFDTGQMEVGAVSR